MKGERRRTLTMLPQGQLAQIRRALRLEHVPTEIPYDYRGLGLKLPDCLTDLESREVLGAVLATKALMHQGDFACWVQAHPGGSHLQYDELVRVFTSLFGKQSFFNRKSTAKLVPISERFPNLSFRHYDATSSLPPERRERLLKWAHQESVSAKQVAEEAALDLERIRNGDPLPDSPPVRHKVGAPIPHLADARKLPPHMPASESQTFPAVSRLTGKGQATIPEPVRAKLNLNPGDTVIFGESEDGAVYLRKAEPLDVEFLSALQGTLSEWNSENDEKAFGDL